MLFIGVQVSLSSSVTAAGHDSSMSTPDDDDSVCAMAFCKIPIRATQEKKQQMKKREPFVL